MIMDIIGYIRSFFGGSGNKRKRSATDDSELVTTPFKVPKFNSSLVDGQWSTPDTSLNRSRQSFMDPLDIRFKTINLDDDAPSIKKPNVHKTKSQFTSTPAFKMNGYKSNTSNSSCASSIKKTQKNEDIEHIQSKMYASQTNALPYKNLMKNITTRKKLEMPTPGKSTEEYAFDLNSKRQYAELVKNSRTTLDYSKFAPKFLSSRKIASKVERSGIGGKKLIQIDLTNGHSGNTKSSRSALSTRDTIIKVLNRSETNEVVEVKDSDSDIEILPTPPSPKPDFKVERINSLKSYVLPSEPFHKDWIKNKVCSHEEEIARRQKEIEQHTTSLHQIREINKEVQLRTLEHRVNRCLLLKEVILPVEVTAKLPPLTPKQEEMVNTAFDTTKNPAQILSSKFSLHISRRDMMTLAGLNWLNDEVINFYMNLIIERGKNPNYPTAYAFNTFFYPKLLKDGHSSIRRWTRKIDLFTYDIICVPIHLQVHWCMAVIDIRRKFIGYYDSMGSPNHQCVDLLFKYLRDEHLDKKKSAYDMSKWTTKCLKDIPQQMNGSDCGMFSCTYAEFLSRDAELSFSQEDMPYLRRKMVVEIMTGDLLIK